ncbi:MAG: hypothetical protein M3X11_07385, partial [Acidobacteriota bacterium]|nr:hypothetical protein [Acidobacteriota bacterium]
VVSFAQPEQAGKSIAPPDKTVTISISAKGVRFAALGSTGQMRLEVFSASGASLYNSEFKAGNVRDWALEDNLGQPLLDGIYQCVITLRDLSGRLSLKQGTVMLQSGQASLQLSEGAQAGAVEPDRVLAPVSDGKETAVTLVTHDGKDGQVVNTLGSLTFKLGDFFAGHDKELMRLTPDGKLGLGVSDPQAKLDVAGPIRTSEGVVFPDGTVQTTAYLASGRSLGERSRLQQRDPQGRAITEQGEKLEPGLRFAPSISGTGTTNRLTKWIDGPGGVVGDTSSLTEIGGSFGLGRTPDSFRLDLLSIGRYASRFVSQTGTGDLFNIYNNNGGNLIFGLESSTGNSIFNGTSAYSAVIGHDNARSLHLATNNIVRQTIDSSGNVGIGTTSPAHALQVNGTTLMGAPGGVYGYSINGASPGPYPSLSFNAFYNNSGAYLAGTAGYGGVFQFSDGDGKLQYFNTVGSAGTGGIHTFTPRLIILKNGNVGIGTTTPDAGVKLHAEGGSTSIGVYGTSTLYTGVYGESISGRGVRGESTSSDGVYGTSGSGSGVRGESTSSGYGVYGTSSSGSGVVGYSSSGYGVYGASS